MRFRRLGSPLLALLALLQRTPAVRVAVSLGESCFEAPATSLIKSAAAAVAALGAVDSLAGASSTGLTYTYILTTQNVAQESPYTVPAGIPLSPVAYILTSNPAQSAPQSWAIEGPMPPGLSFGVSGNATTGLGSGVFGLVNVANPTMFGTPTTPGAYVMYLQAYQLINGGGYYSSVFAYKVTVTATNSAPVFTLQPAGQSISAGGSATLSVTVSGYPAPTFQWNLNGSPVAGATSATLSISNATSANGGTYTCVASNSSGNTTSNGAVLTVIPTNVAPTFVLAASPSTSMVASGRTAVFNAIATGTPAPTYQWKFNNSTTIPGAAVTTDPILMVTGATPASAGTYTCTATNSAGSVSSSATLSVVTTANPGYLNNVSALGYVGTGAGILIGGFNVIGSGSKEILVRGIGPGLNTAFQLNGYLPNPYAELFSGSNPVMTGGSPVQNDNWSTPDYPGAPIQGTVATAMATLGAYSLPALSQDAAILTTVPVSGSVGYTVEVSGIGGETGTGVVEIYDADSGAPSVRLNNLSARNLVETGQNILIGGFSIAGSTDETVLIRAVGPGLNSTFGLTGILAQPVLTLFRGPTQIYSNTTWAGDPVLTAAQATVGAYPLVPTSTDSLLLVTLSPGGYTAQITGVNATTGIAVVEVYEVQ